MDTVVFKVLEWDYKIDNFLEQDERILKINKYESVPILKYTNNGQQKYLIIYIDDFIKVHKFITSNSNSIIMYGKSYEQTINTCWNYMRYLVEYNYIDILDYLRNYYLDKKNIDIFVTRNYDLIKYASALSNIETFRFLFNAVEFEDSYDTMFEVFLFSACKNGNYENAQLLLNKLNYSDAAIDRSLFFAIEGDHINIIDLLIDRGARINAEKSFYDAFMRNSADTALYFLSKGGSLESITDNDMWCCIWTNHLDSMELLFSLRHFEQYEIDDMFLNAKNCTPEMVQLFINYGANMEHKKELTEKAKNCENIKLVKYLEKNN